MTISIVTQQPSIADNEEDGPPEYWSGLAKCPSVGTITPLKQQQEQNRQKRSGANGTCWNWKMALLILTVIGVVSLIAYIYIKRHQLPFDDKSQEHAKNDSKKPGLERWLNASGLIKEVPPQFDHFIFTEPLEGPLGNQMFRFASLFAMGQMLNRTPVYMDTDLDMKKMETELAQIFPHFHERLYFLKDDFDEYEKVAMAKDCCDYHDPKKLLSHNQARALMLTGGPNFQNYRYFADIRPRILELFEFNPKMVKKVANIRKRMMKDDKMHKVCVHTRTGNLNAFGQLKTYQLKMAIQRVLQMLPKMRQKKQTPKYSLLFIGESADFQESINRKTGNWSLNKVYHVVDAGMSKDEELCFALLSCDSLFLTDSLSPYAFWMGYLMPEDRLIFYVRKQLGLSTTKVDTMKLLPSDWLPIEEDWLKVD